jgi:hypothetical protein
MTSGVDPCWKDKCEQRENQAASERRTHRELVLSSCHSKQGVLFDSFESGLFGTDFGTLNPACNSSASIFGSFPSLKQNAYL